MKKRLVSFFLAAGMLALCACGQDPGVKSNSVDLPESAMNAANKSRNISYAPIAIDHGEDYVIEWEDEGMEAHVRFWLDRPQGDIYHSDVWDYQAIVIAANLSTGYDIALKQPIEGFDAFTEDIFYNENADKAQLAYNSDTLQGAVTGGKSFPAIVSLRDLRHFDSLVIFSVANSVQSRQLVADISGLEGCTNLKYLDLIGAKPETLASLSALDKLENLSLRCDADTDLSPLQGLAGLSRLRLDGDELPSLEALAALPGLSSLTLGVTRLPNLEPLAQSGVEYLDMLVDLGVKGEESGDYEPLSRMKKLVWLDMTNRGTLDYDTCAKIIAGVPTLKYLNITNTTAARRGGELDTSNLEVFTCGTLNA